MSSQQSWFRKIQAILLIFLPISLFSPLTAGGAPPLSLLREASKKSEAVIYCRVESVQTPPGGFTETTVKIVKVYRGPFREGDALKYYSFKEEGSYPKAMLDRGLIAFLASREIGGRLEWGESTEFFEFEYSPKLEKRVISIIKKGK